LSLSFRFVPTLVDESKRIMNAQASRGVDFSNGNYLDKIKSLVALIIPVFTIGFLKSIDLANAMEARGFIANSVTTKYRQYKITAYDLIVLFLVGIIMAFILMLIILHVILTPIGIFDLSIQNK
jgi:energy-coupling factor transport system permease protein